MKLLSLIGLFVLILAGCKSGPKVGKIKPDQEIVPEKHQLITLGGGCYWCIEAVFQQLDGVISSTSGFMGGFVPDPDYEEVCQGTTGHIEVIQVAYDPEIISTNELLEWFWKAHDPTDPFGQGGDRGERYLSHIFYHSEEQKELAEASKEAAQKDFNRPIVTTIREAEPFYKAKQDHQDYYFNNKSKNSYCPAVITPKLKKLNLEH